MAKDIRVALIGGSDISRAARREMLATSSRIKVVHDSDGYSLKPESLHELIFDVAILELRLSGESALDFLQSAFQAARMANQVLGKVLISAQFNEPALRVQVIAAGAVDCVFVSDGLAELIRKIERCVDDDEDFAIRELLPTLSPAPSSGLQFQESAVLLDTLSELDSQILSIFSELKSDGEISNQLQISRAKVRQAVQNIIRLLGLETRSQLLLRLFQLGMLSL